MRSMPRLFIIYNEWFKIVSWKLLLVKSWLIMAYCLFFHNHQPDWSGYMQSVTTGAYSEKYHIKLLPIVDLSASQANAIYSVLQYIL